MLFPSSSVRYAWAEESTSIRGNKSAQAAICGLRQGVEEEHTYLSSQLEKWGVDASKYSSEPVEYCQFITAKFPFCNDAHYVAFLLASTITFISLSAYLARKLKRVAHPKYLHWIERFASESFQASCMQNEQVLNDICKDANLSLNSGKVGGFGIEIHYRKAMQLSVNFFARHVTIEECCIVPLTKEHNPARELILVACALDSPCCSYMKCEAYTKDFTCLVLNIIPIVKVGFVHENVRNALSQLADFQVKATGIKDIDEVNIGQSFTDLLLTIGSSKNTCNARVHVVAALYDNYDNKLKSAVSSECMDKCILHTNLESSTVKLDLFREISRNTNNEKLLSIYVGNGIDDLGCLLEADIGIVLNPCPELLFLSTQFGVSFVPLWEVTVAKQKQMREGIHFLWKSRTGTLYVVKTLDEITAFMYGAFKIDCTPETKNASGPYESSSLGNLFSSLPKPKSASQSAYFSLVENMRFEKQQAEKPEIYLTSATPRKPPKKEKLPLALILPKPKNLNLSVDSSNVEKKEQAEQQDVNQKEEDAVEDGNKQVEKEEDMQADGKTK
ncbi:bifunctional TH2 protein, mitochondrial isoform X2 [Rosa chinensis]|uniref:bifunctional TH2 protein, mitochondrial isoform X2 n=1 Tax=Rosa chinensis TaxID=74649 RepID=UPI001AD8B546|nr:bifunctional TH2 protein, mitochondrial isoform X2 [Rosa chinensis]